MIQQVKPEINRKILYVVFLVAATTLFVVTAVVNPDLIMQAVQIVVGAIMWVIEQILKLIFRAVFGVS